MYQPIFLGQGAISSLLAAKCQQLNIAYSVLGRQPQLTTIDYIQHNNRCCFTPRAIQKEQLTAHHLLVLPVKAYQVQTALEQLSAYLPDVPILLFHNGMGTIEQSKQLLPDNPILAATTNYGALKDQHNQLKQTGIGDTNIGWVQHPDNKLQQWLSQTLNQLLPPVYWRENIQVALWQKLAINSVINPITAIEQVANGQLLDKQYQPLIDKLCQEIAGVMCALGIDTTAISLVETVYKVCHATADNFSSMNRDIFYQRPTEIDFINGYVRQQAQILNLTADTNNTLYQQVKQLEAKNQR